MKKTLNKIGLVANVTLGVIFIIFVGCLLVYIANGLFEGDTIADMLFYYIDWEDAGKAFLHTYIVYMPIAQIVTFVVGLVKKLFKR